MGGSSGGRRHYFQCVLARAELWARGVESFRSDKSQQYYVLLLNDKLDGVTPENTKRRLQECGWEVKDLASLERPAKVCRHDSSGDEIAGNDGGLAPDPVPGDDGGDLGIHVAVAAADAAPLPDEASGGDEIGGDEDPDAYVPPAAMDGVHVTVEEHYGRSGVSNRGLRVKCPGCNVRRFSALSKEQGFSALSAELHLRAWLRLCTGTPAHRRIDPSWAQMEAARV